MPLVINIVITVYVIFTKVFTTRIFIRFMSFRLFLFWRVLHYRMDRFLRGSYDIFLIIICILYFRKLFRKQIIPFNEILIRIICLKYFIIIIGNIILIGNVIATTIHINWLYLNILYGKNLLLYSIL